MLLCAKPAGIGLNGFPAAIWKSRSQDADMSRQDSNTAFALTSFLDGGNAAYIDDLYARYQADAQAVDAEWQAFFQSLKDDSADVARNARGPSWRRPDWPQPARNEFTAALDGNWREVERALSDKIKAK